MGDLTTNSPLFEKSLKLFFNFSIHYKVGDGASIILWEHDWGHGVLKCAYQNLYMYAWDPDISLCEGKETVQTVATMFRSHLAGTSSDGIAKAEIS